MVFKRRNKRTIWQSVSESILPRRGWKRAITYLGHRLKRLPDSPHKISLGLAVGVWLCFSPFFGLHMVLSVLLSYILRANIIAALLGTMLSAPPPIFVLIIAINFKIGAWMTGTPEAPETGGSILHLFREASLDLWHNLKSVFSGEVVDWTNLIEFFHSIVMPYTIGGIVPGTVSAVVAYFMSKPLIYAYQHRRRGRLLERFNDARLKVRKGGADDAD